MPYSGASDKDLPAYVKKLGAKDKRQWVAVFNSAYSKCTNGGGDTKECESSAFAQANGVVKVGGRAMDIQELWESIKRLFEPHLQERIKDVAKWDGAASRYSSTEAYCKACLINENTGSAADWKQTLCKLPVKDTDGQPVRQAIHAAAAALAGARGGIQATPEDKKKAANKIITYYNQMDETAPDSVYKVAGKTPPERTTAYLPTQTRSFTVTRSTDGQLRWLLIAASAVVNKVGAIDSTLLFDSFIRHAGETGEYPALDFLHEEDRLRFGAADWLARDGALYLASGTFDDTELARAAAAGLEKDADYWGASISYRITTPPLLMQAEGTIPVYTDGVNNYISIVPRKMAANLFTAATVTEEVIRMDKHTFDELVRLVGPAAAQQFADQVDDANRTITDTGMVTRADASSTTTTTTPPEATAIVETTTTAPEAERVDVVAAVPVEPAAPSVTLEGLAQKVSELEAKISALVGLAQFEEMSTRAVDEQRRAISQIEELSQRLAGVEASKARWDEWLNDAPEHIKREAEGVFRARNQPPAMMTMAQLAEQNVSKLNRGPHQKRPGGA